MAPNAFSLPIELMDEFRHPASSSQLTRRCHRAYNHSFTMRRYRHLALVLLILYSAFAVGIHLHSHGGADTVNPDCKLCQASHLSLIQTPETHCAPDASVITSTEQVTATAVFFEATPVISGRAPPTV